MKPSAARRAIQRTLILTYGETARRVGAQLEACLSPEQLPPSVVSIVTLTTESPDNTARQKAIESIYDIAGVRGRRAESTGDSGPVITINVPSYYDRQFLKDEGVVDVSSDPIEDNRDDP